MTAREDLCEWKYLPQQQHLFSKHTSIHFISDSQQLARDVGKYFEPIPSVTATISSVADEIVLPSTDLRHETSVMSRIEQLECQFATQAEELRIWQMRAKDELELRVRAQQQVKHSKTTVI